jgi:DNA-binding LytR/AlgR family response regulator
MALAIIKSHAAKVPFIHLLATFVDGLEAMAYMQKQKVDLIFLDIHMPDLSGLQLAECLPGKPFIIFTTAYSEYAVESYEVRAIDYLLKPFEFNRFLKAVTRAQEQFELNESNAAAKTSKDYFFIKSGYQQIKVKYDEILYVEAAGNYMCFFTPTSKILSRLTIKEVLELLPQTQFMRVHKSYIVALPHIQRIEHNHIFIRQSKIPIGANYIDDVSKMLNAK